MKQKTSTIQKVLQLFLAGSCLVLCYLLWAETKPMSLPDETGENINNEAYDEALAFPGIENTIPNINEFDEMINRPLFSENRQPFVLEAIDEKKPESQKPNSRKPREEYSLNAVIITPAKKIAIIQSSKAKELQRVALGENIDDWTLESIEPREIKLANGKETKTLVLEVKNSSPSKKTPQSNIEKKTSNQKEKRETSSIPPSSDRKKINQIKKNIENIPDKANVEDEKDEKLIENQKSNEEN